MKYSSGYYLYLKNGKLLKKKQPYYASTIGRLHTLPVNESPGPGAYFSRKGSIMKGSVKRRPLSLISEKIRIIDKSELGPGSYNAKIEQIKPRIKGISKWVNKPLSKVSQHSASLDTSLMKSMKVFELNGENKYYNVNRKRHLHNVKKKVEYKTPSAKQSDINLDYSNRDCDINSTDFKLSYTLHKTNLLPNSKNIIEKKTFNSIKPRLKQLITAKRKSINNKVLYIHYLEYFYRSCKIKEFTYED